APDWLKDHMQPVRQTQIGELPVQQFMPWQVQPGETEKTPRATIGEAAEITGVQTSFEPDQQLLVWVYWHPLRQTEHPLKAFVHLVGPVNPATSTPLWSQDDHFPQNERIRTDSWSPSETYRDTFNLPLADVPSGDYDLFIGLYDPDTGQRIASGETNRFLLTTLTIPAD
ncbi:MAG: DUF4832 domain-containing protein, partial [Anaerolineae bacterium]|nr:DUF4832 domain-containing protein [Anaerolineae bacterium]